MSKPVVEFKEVTFQYRNKQGKEASSILESLDFQAYQGEFISIIGPSGSGKSTLFRLVTGLEQPTGGEIFINDQSYNNRLGRVGYMPQEDLLMPWRSVMDNASLPLELKGVKKADAHVQVKELLDAYGLKGFENHYPGDLSGGMKQRVSFLRTILSGSNVLLLDEPFSALDAITRLSMQEWLLKQWEKWNKTILFITHDVNEALLLSDRIFIFSETPVHSLEEVVVPLERPRDVHDLKKPPVMELNGQLIDLFRAKVKP